MKTQVNAVRAAIHAVIDSEGPALVAKYYAEDGPFAARLFDELPNNAPFELTADDLVAASLLDVRFGPAAVRALLIEPAAVNDLLTRLGEDRPLWEVEDLSQANALWRRLRAVPIGPTRTSKLLSRKRPKMLPILDSVISKHLCLSGADDRWALLRDALSDESLRQAIDAMTPVGFKQPTTLRLLDVATWMRHSESANARRARQECGLSVEPRS